VLDIDGIKRELPLPYVAERLGVPLSESGGKLVGPCPFHDDDEPSFDIYGERLERWGCFPCGIGGDVLDLVQRTLQLGSVVETMDMCRQYVKEFRASDWDGPTVGASRRPFDLASALEVIHTSDLMETGYLDYWLSERSETRPGLAALSGSWLNAQFKVGETGTEIVIPYLDRDGAVVGYKHRSLTTPALAASGSVLKDVLYGEWRVSPAQPGSPQRPVILCEGESDTWAAAFAFSDTHDVLGLPTGSGSPTTSAVRLEGRDVTLAFDGDEAGRAGVRRWWAALTAVHCTVRIAQVPDEQDLCSVPDLRALLRNARIVPDPPRGFLAGPSCFYKTSGDNQTPLSNFGFSPTRELRGPDGAAFEGLLLPTQEPAVLTAHEASSRTRLSSWAVKQGAAWYGSDREAAQLLGWLQSMAPFLAPGESVSTAGLYDGQFVFPGGSIGQRDIRYVDPVNSVHLSERISIGSGPWSTAEVLALRALHRSEVTDPILAWLALAPVRSLLGKFPILAVTGSSGSGKTTLMETMLRHFTGSVIGTNLTSTTRHALFSFVGCTNGFPVWFDEYRPGARKDTMMTLEQVLRDAYTGQSSSKGGMGEGWAEVTSVAACAPIVVSGEDAFAETSHTERMVLVALPPRGRNADALEAVTTLGSTGLTRAYLTWLMDGLASGEIPEIVNYRAGRPDLPDRQRYNIGALDLGWRLLQAFMRAHGSDLPAPCWDLIEREGIEAASSNPIRDALLWAVESDHFDARESVVASVLESGDPVLYVRVDNLVHFINRHSDFQLPGGAKAIKKYLTDNYRAEETRTRAWGGNPKRALVMEDPR